MKPEPSAIVAALRSPSGLRPSLITGSDVMHRRSFLRGLSLTSLLCVCGSSLQGSNPNCTTCQRIATLTTERDGIWDQLTNLSPQITSLQFEIDALQAIIDDPESNALAVHYATTSKISKNQELDRKNDRFEELSADWRSKDDEIISLSGHNPCPAVTGHWETREIWIVTGTEWVVTGGSWTQGEYLGDDEFGNPMYGPDLWVESGEWQDTGYWGTEEVWVEDVA